MSEFRYRVWEAFGRSLREVRREQGMSQAELGAALTRFGPGGSQSAIAKMERGERLVSVDHLAALVWILGVEVDRLLPKVVSAEDRHGDVAALLSERDQLSAERVQWQGRWERLQKRLVALDAIPDQRLGLGPSGG